MWSPILVRNYFLAAFLREVRRVLRPPRFFATFLAAFLVERFAGLRVLAFVVLPAFLFAVLLALAMFCFLSIVNNENLTLAFKKVHNY